jgi:ER-bound oxygenase mpaB/B'/Rubber oxygenase, catalytic domain
MKRYALREKTGALDPERDFEEINRLLATVEFPWDINQALSFALFRTYAVPSVGQVLFDTGEFTERVQKRYDDTTLLLDAVLEHGFDSAPGRNGIRRVNQMHGNYDISNDDMRYVLATFVVTPVRWIEHYGWRRLTHNEVVGATNYYRRLGTLMGIKGIPATYTEFVRFLDEYEATHFAYNAGARKVADSTLDLMTTFPPNNRAPKWLINIFARSLMDDSLLRAFAYRRPPRPVRALSRGALKARGRLVRFFPVRKQPMYARDLPNIRSYPGGYDLQQLGTFPVGCPVAHNDSAGEVESLKSVE